MVASLGDVEVFAGGLILGTLMGLVLGPVLRFWLNWHEWRDASRKARLTEEVLARMDARPLRPPNGAGVVGPGPGMSESIPRGRWRPRS